MELGYRIVRGYTLAEALKRHYAGAGYPSVGLAVYNRGVAVGAWGMWRRSSSRLRRHLRHRAEALSRGPALIKGFLGRLREAAGLRATIMVFGEGGSPESLYSREPRDLDLLIVVDGDAGEVEELVHRVKL
ncbi:MAG: hypothetical protein DRK00_10660 [Thermoprotei archaeon]|nr:MAG: hypothetical protein DRK00_10660 [Thermoprotei archaeon]